MSVEVGSAVGYLDLDIKGFLVPVHGILSYLPAFIGTKLGGDSP